jgi:CHAT domain-containing protein
MSPELEALRAEAERFSGESSFGRAAEAWKAVSAAAEAAYGEGDPRTLAALSRMVREAEEHGGRGGEDYQGIARRAWAGLAESLGADSAEALFAETTAARLAMADGDPSAARAAVHAFAHIAGRAAAALGPTHPLALTATLMSATALRGAGEAKAAAQAFREAAESCSQALGPDSPEALAAENGLAFALIDLGDLDEAAGILKRTAEARARALGPEHPEVLSVKASLASALSRLGRHGEAEGLYRESLEGMRGALGPSHPATLRCLDNMAGALSRRGDLAGAAALSRESVGERVRSLGPASPETLSAKNSLARVLIEQGEYAEARDLYGEVLEARARDLGPEHPSTLASKANLATVLSYLADLARARDLAREALEARKLTLGADHEDTLYSMNLLANILVRLGDFGGARDMQRELLEAARRALGNEHPYTLGTMNNLGSTLGRIGDHAGALELHREVLETGRRVFGPDHQNTLTSLHNLASAAEDMGDLAGARDLYREALEARRRALGQGHPQALTSANSLANVLFALGEPAEAKAMLTEVLETSLRLRGMDDPVAGVSAASLGSILASEGSLEEAAFFLKLSVQSAQGQRGRLASLEPELRRSWLATVENRYRRLFDVLMRLGRGEEALWVLGLLKEDELSELDADTAYPPPSARRAPAAREAAAAGASAGASAAPAPAWGAGGAGQETSLFIGAPEEPAWKDFSEAAAASAAAAAARGALAEKREEEGLLPEEQARLAALDEEDRKARAGFAKALDRLPGLLASAEAKAAPPPAWASERFKARREALAAAGAGAALVYAVSAEKTLHVTLITPEGLAAGESAVTREELAGLVAEFRAAFQNPAKDPRPLGARLYGHVFAPVEEALKASGAHTLMLSLDGALRYVPMAALWDGERWLAEKYPTVIVTESTVERMRDSARPDRPSARAFGVTREWPGFPALPGVAAELAAVVRGHGSAGKGPGSAEGRDSAGGAGSRPGEGGSGRPAGSGEREAGALEGEALLDSEFTREALSRGLASEAPVVHVASHFRLDPRSIANTALLLGDGATLSLAEIKSSPDLDFKGLDLLTLSACDTASGDWRRVDGKEVESFGEIVQRAGGAAVLASLSPVDDLSAPDLMREFYRLRYLQGLDKASALQAAQLSVMRNVSAASSPARGKVISAYGEAGESAAGGNAAGAPPWEGAGFSHPYFWGTFVLMGDWK